MPKSAWPSTDDVIKLLWSAGLVDPAAMTPEFQALVIPEQINEAVGWWEKKTRWQPFLCLPTRVQWVYLYGNPTAGSCTLIYGSQETAPITSFAASDIQAALEALTAIGTGKVTVTGDYAGPFTVTLDTSLAPYDFIEAGNNSLVGNGPQILCGEPPLKHDVAGPRFLMLRSGYTEIGAVFGDAYYGNLGTFLPQTIYYGFTYWQDNPDLAIIALQALAWGWGQGWQYYGGRQSTNIVGRRGFSKTVPDDAWTAVLRYAAQGCLPMISAARTGDAQKWREGDVSEDYGVKGPYGNLSDDWTQRAACTAMSYFRTKAGS